MLMHTTYTVLLLKYKYYSTVVRNKCGVLVWYGTSIIKFSTDDDVLFANHSASAAIGIWDTKPITPFPF